MGRESRPDVVDRIQRKFGTPRQRAGALSDRDVVAKHAQHDRMMGIPVGSIGRKEHHPVTRERLARLRPLARESLWATTSAWW
jgi:hypothetical protein